MKEIISTPNAPAAAGPYSQAVKVNDLLFCSGQIALDPSSGTLTGDNITTQTEQVMQNISAVLAASETTFDDVVKTTCFLADINDFADFNAVYRKYFTSCPARSCVAAAALPKGALVEVEVTAICKTHCSREGSFVLGKGKNFFSREKSRNVGFEALANGGIAPLVRRSLVRRRKPFSRKAAYF